MQSKKVFFRGSIWLVHMDVSKNNGTPKWMVKMMENPINMDDFGGPPLFPIFQSLGIQSPSENGNGT